MSVSDRMLNYLKVLKRIGDKHKKITHERIHVLQLQAMFADHAEKEKVVINYDWFEQQVLEFLDEMNKQGVVVDTNCFDPLPDLATKVRRARMKNKV